MFTMASTSVGSDPLTDIVARLLAVPLREVYAVLLPRWAPWMWPCTDRSSSL